MSTEKECKEKIQSLTYPDLKIAWRNFKENRKFDPFWEAGKFLEYSILRAFELEIIEKNNGYVTYPFNVSYPKFGEEVCDSILEQIDGAICANGLYSLIECKDYSNKIKIEPLSKLRNILSKRHGNLFGMFFSLASYTTPAQIQVQFMAPQIIILWENEDIDYCFENKCFVECMCWKYQQAIERCEYNLRYKQYKNETQLCLPLF